MNRSFPLQCRLFQALKSYIAHDFAGDPGGTGSERALRVRGLRPSISRISILGAKIGNRTTAAKSPARKNALL
jgi:hypothetical protein